MLLLQAGYSYVPYVSLDEYIEQNKAEYYLALRTTQKNHKTDCEDITPWTDYLLSALVEQAERARRIMDEDQPEKLLSEKQKEVYQLFTEGKEMGVAEVVMLLEGRIERETIKQALSRLVKLKLLERVGQGRGTRYVRI
jgi:Fic family protein